MSQLPIGQFLTTVLEEYDSTFELRVGTGFEQLFFKPMEFILQPLRDEANTLFVAQSFNRILQTADPDAFDTEAVDALAGNLFVSRQEGDYSSGVGRAYYNEPYDIEYPANGATFTGSNGISYTNPAPFSITATEMSAQIDNTGLYYFDIPLESTVAGADTVLDVGQLVTLVGDTNVVSVTNMLAFEGGLDMETNTNFIARVQASIAVRDLVTGKGFNAILFENFVNFLVEVQPIGFGDQEMQRDIVYNTHIGGKVDGYVKTSAITPGSQTFVGILPDTTRQAFTSKNVQLIGTDAAYLGQSTIDRSNGLVPVVMEIKISTAGQYVTTILAAPPATFNLATNQYIKIGINGTFYNIRIAGVIPSATTRNEIINLINAAVGQNVAFVYGNYIQILSPTVGLSSQIVITNPDIGLTAIAIVFGLSSGGAPYIYNGDGPVTYNEGINYTIDDANGTITRIIGISVLGAQTTGVSVHNSATFNDPTANIFLNVEVRDILTITSGPDAGDYRVLDVVSNNQLVLDEELTTNSSSVDYYINRTGIKSGEVVYVTYYYNPVSIDIGQLIQLDQYGLVRGIRPGREATTITDLAFLRITSIQEVDPLTLEPNGTTLRGTGGWGAGGYGDGPYGIGTDADYRLVVNNPGARFSMFEDSFILFSSTLAGLSFQINYEYVPEISELHNFVLSANERVLDGDMLMKHYLPAYVEGTINYTSNPNDSTTPAPATVQQMVQAFITAVPSGTPLVYSRIAQYILTLIDPFNTYGCTVEPISLTATIHNADGTITRISGTDSLVIPTLTPFPSATPHPLSPRITHWIAEADLQVVGS